MSCFEMHLAFIRQTFGHPRREPARDPETVATAVIQGDGRFDEAAAAVAYWCDYTQEEAQQFITDLHRKWRESVRAKLLEQRQTAGESGPETG